MKLIVSIAIACAAGCAARADVKLPVLQVGSEIYSNVTVWNQTATDIYFNHARGMGNVKLKHLDPELQKRFGYDPVKAGETEKQQIEANLAYRQQLHSLKPVPVDPATNRTPGTAGRNATAELRVPNIRARSFRNRVAPEFVVEKWLTAKPDYTDKFLLVDFWATWCGPCRRSIPALNELHSKFKDRLVIVGLSDESEADVRKMTSPKIDYYVAIDPSARMRNAVGVQGIPHALLLDSKGIVRFEGHPGYLNESAVAGLLDKFSN